VFFDSYLDEVPMSRRLLLLLPTVLAAIALPASSALAGEGDGDDSGSATLRATHTCVSGDRAKAKVTGDEIDSVAFFLDGQHITTVTEPNAGDNGFRLSMRCRNLSMGAHRARAVVSFQASASASSRTLRFQVTRARQVSPQFTG
jgi:hypothetical protein